MVKHELEPITIQQIKMFLCIADTHSFTHSAHMLNMTQPGISKSLAKLEEILGFPLFVRTKKHVTLTTAGELLYREWKEGLIFLERSYLNAKASSTEHTQSLRIGIAFSLNSQLVLSPYLRAWEATYPTQMANVVEENLESLVRHLENKMFDVVLLPDSERYSLDPYRFAWHPFGHQTMYAVLSSNHPLAQRSSLSMSELTDYPHIIFDPILNNNAKTFLAEQFRKLEKSPVLEGYYKSSYELHRLLKGTQRICLTDYYYNDTFQDDCVKIPVHDLISGILCVYNKEVEDEVAMQFVTLCKELPYHTAMLR